MSSLDIWLNINQNFIIIISEKKNKYKNNTICYLFNLFIIVKQLNIDQKFKPYIYVRVYNCKPFKILFNIYEI